MIHEQKGDFRIKNGCWMYDSLEARYQVHMIPRDSISDGK